METNPNLVLLYGLYLCFAEYGFFQQRTGEQNHCEYAIVWDMGRYCKAQEVCVRKYYIVSAVRVSVSGCVSFIAKGNMVYFDWMSMQHEYRMDTIYDTKGTLPAG